MEDKTLELALLFDFFGDLLTPKQREAFDLYYNEDLSLSEIAEISGISRQGVRDFLVKAEKSLRELEEKTGVVARFVQVQHTLSEAEDLARELIASSENELTRQRAGKLLDALESLKG